MKLRKFVTKDWVHVSPGLVLGVEGKRRRPMKLDILFIGIVVGRSKCGITR